MPSVIRGGDNFDSLAAQGLGHNQTWQDVAADRATNTIYTNTTGRAIMVSVVAQASGATGNRVTCNLRVDGVPVSQAYAFVVNSLCGRGTVTGVVPPGSEYVVRLQENGEVVFWTEMK